MPTFARTQVVFRRRRHWLPYAKAASGTLYTLSVGGGITPAGTVVKREQRTLAAGITPAGALAKQAQRALTAGITPAGTVAKQAQRALVGGITPSGTLARRT